MEKFGQKLSENTMLKGKPGSGQDNNLGVPDRDLGDGVVLQRAHHNMGPPAGLTENLRDYKIILRGGGEGSMPGERVFRTVWLPMHRKWSGQRRPLGGSGHIG